MPQGTPPEQVSGGALRPAELLTSTRARRRVAEVEVATKGVTAGLQSSGVSVCRGAAKTKRKESGRGKHSDSGLATAGVSG